MIKCNKCNRDKNFNQYHVTGATAHNVCKPCLNKIAEEYDTTNSRD